MAKYIIKDGKLYNADELYHAKWKYIKREWIKGKWRYWYDNSKLKKNLTKATDRAKDKLGYDEKQKIIDAKKNADAAKKQLSVIKYNTAESKDAQKVMVKNATKNVDKATAAVNKAIKEYSKTPLGIIDNIKDKVDKGKNAIKQMFKNDKPVNSEEDRQKKIFAKLDAEGKLHETKTYQPIDDFEDLPRKFSSRDEDMAAVNPNYNPFKRDYSYNCQRCTFAYEMRRRGYDVEAVAETSSSNISMLTTGMGNYYVGGKDKMCNISNIIENYLKRNPTEKKLFKSITLNARVMEDELLSHGEGARGHLAFGWLSGGGHVVNWEVENGEVVIRDAQTNEKHNIQYYWRYVKPNTTQYIRTDNLELKPEALKFVKRKER